MIASPSIAVRSFDSPVSARADASAAKGASSAARESGRATSSFRDFLQQNSVDADTRDSDPSSESSTPESASSGLTTDPSLAGRSSASPLLARAAAASAATGANTATDAPNRRSISLAELLQLGSVGPVADDSAPIAGSQPKDGKQKQSAADSQDPDSAALPVPSGNLLTGLAVTAETVAAGQAQPQRATIMAKVAAGQAQPQRSFAGRADAGSAAGLPATNAATEEEFHVEWNNGAGTGSQTELAFALRLKPLASAATNQAAASSSALNASEPGVKTGDTSGGAIAALVAAKSANKQDGNPQSGSQDGSGKDHSASRETALADQPEKSARTESQAASAPAESASVRTQGEESRVTPLIHSAASPAVPEGPASPKAATPSAPVPAPLSTDMDERLTTTRPMKEISLQISSAGEQKVDVRLVERAGEVLVSVHTQDTALAHEMRQELGSLTGKLAQSGYGTEQFAPSSASSTNLSDQRDTPQNQDSSHGQQQGQQDAGSGQQQQSQDERGKRPAWVEEMENSLAQRQTNRSTA